MKKKSVLLMLIIFLTIFILYINSCTYAFTEVENIKDLSNGKLRDELNNMIIEMTNARGTGRR